MSLDSAQRSQTPLLTLVVPVLNEEDSIQPFLDAVLSILSAQRLNFEILFINDGSTDHTLDRIIGICDTHHQVRAINLSRNFGKEAALSAGLANARGDAIIPIDVDLQDPPELIPRFLEKWQAGYDIVYGIRTDRSSDTFSKRQTAEWFYVLFNRLSSIKIPPNAGDFRLIDRRVAEVIRDLPERNRFMKGLFSWVGFKSTGVPYQRTERAHGHTKFNHWKLWNFALDGLLSFSTVPLRVWTYFGGLVSFLAFVYGSFIIARTLFYGADLPGYASLLTTVLFLGGLQLLSIGIIGEYIARMFLEAKARPLYVIESVYPQHNAAKKTVT